MSQPGAYTIHVLLLVVIFCFASNPVTPAPALLNIDFEHAFYVHPTIQVWDPCLVHHEGLYHIFYHGIPESNPHASRAHHIWHSTSDNMIHWSKPEVVLSISDEPYESLAIWAPSVVYDDVADLWWMAYTGVDQFYNQRICMAHSNNLRVWRKSHPYPGPTSLNPVLEPDPSIFHYPSSSGGAECRDPFLYRGDDGLWHMLVSAKLRGMSGGQGVIARSTSSNMRNWAPLEVFLYNDGTTPTRTLESVQYHVVNGVHHVFFHEHYVGGLSHIATLDPAEWTFANRNFLDSSIAPEVLSIDGGEHYTLTRIVPYQNPGNSAIHWVARTDTLLFPDEGIAAAPAIYRPHPLARHFVEFSGHSTLGNPCFGDNPARRGETPAGVVGNFYFGSKEYYQGPLSGRGAPGSEIGVASQGVLNSYPFEIQGHSITMLVGGTNRPTHCYIALIDAETGTVLHRSTGDGIETMSPRTWDVSDLRGQTVFIRIEDKDTSGYINVDEIKEVVNDVTTVENHPHASSAFLTDLGPCPNPFNPATVLRFELYDPTACRVRIHDLRGRLIWDSQSFMGQRGLNSVPWHGTNTAGLQAASGVYVYRVEAKGTIMATGKLTLVP